MSPSNKSKEWYKQRLDPKLSLGILSFFAMVVSLYLIANCRVIISSPVVSESTQAPQEIGKIETIKPLKIKEFTSENDFVKYIEAGLRKDGDEIFDAAIAQKIFPEVKIVGKTSEPVKKVLLKPKDEEEIINSETAQRYLFGLAPTDSDQNVKKVGDFVYYSSENQFFAPASIAQKNSNFEDSLGTTAIINIANGQFAQVGLIPVDGKLLATESSIAVFKDTSIYGFDLQNPTAPKKTWQIRIGEGDKIIDARLKSGKILLMTQTQINSSHPCPIEPLIINDKPTIVGCENISHMDQEAVVDLIFNIFLIDPTNGDIIKNISFAGKSGGSIVADGETAIWTTWNQEDNYIYFFAEFINDKCKNLIPDYLRERILALPKQDISLAAKELDLRILISNWLSSLSAEEQSRIASELSNRLDDFVRDRWRQFEMTTIGKINSETLKFEAAADFPGRLISRTSIDENGGNVRLAMSVGRQAIGKMMRFITGAEVNGSNTLKSATDIYVADDNLNIIGSLLEINLPVPACAARFNEKNAYFSTCRAKDPYFVIDMSNPKNPELAGSLIDSSSIAYLAPIDEGRVITISRNGRKSQINLYDVSLIAKIKKTASLETNDFWADTEAAYQAFSIDKNSGLFFIAGARSGNLFSYSGNKLISASEVGDFWPSRSLFDKKNIILLDDSKMSVFDLDNFKKVGSVILQ